MKKSCSNTRVKKKKESLYITAFPLPLLSNDIVSAWSCVFRDKLPYESGLGCPVTAEWKKLKIKCKIPESMDLRGKEEFQTPYPHRQGENKNWI